MSARTRLFGLQRPLALLPMHREAADQIDDRGASVAALTPRTPRPRRAPPESLRKASEGAGRHRFSLSRVTVRAADGSNPGISAPVGGSVRGSTKRRAAFATSIDPRIASISPRFTPFSPRVVFLDAHPFLPFFFFFKREREEIGGGDEAAVASPGLTCNAGIQSLRFGEKTGFPRVFRGTTTNRIPNVFNGLGVAGARSPGFLGEMRPSPAAVVFSGGVNGVR